MGPQSPHRGTLKMRLRETGIQLLVIGQFPRQYAHHRDEQQGRADRTIAQNAPDANRFPGLEAMAPMNTSINSVPVAVAIRLKMPAISTMPSTASNHGSVLAANSTHRSGRMP